mgnify:CR=1 FL=1
MIRITASALMLAASACFALPSLAQEEQNFRITQVFAATHWHWTEGMEFFTKQVEEASGGKITFEPYHAGQLGQDSTQLVTSGLADMGLLVPSYEAEKLPLTTVTELPGFHRTACEGTAMYWKLAQPGGALYENEYKPLGVHPLYVILLPPYQLATSTKKVTNLDELSGLKIRANGAAMDKTVRDLGAVPVRVTTNELYDSLSRGTVDGAFWIIGTTKLVGLEKLLRYTVQGPLLGAGSTFFAISEDKWESLDDETKRILTEAGLKTQEHLCQYLDDTDARVAKELVDEGNLEVTHLTDAEAAVWAERIKTVPEEWAEEMDSTGRPGAAVLEAFREAAANETN